MNDSIVFSIDAMDSSCRWNRNEIIVSRYYFARSVQAIFPKQ